MLKWATNRFFRLPNSQGALVARSETNTDEVVTEIQKILAEANRLQFHESTGLQMQDQSTTAKFRWSVRICFIAAVFLLLNVFPIPEGYLLERLFWLLVFLAGFLMAGRHLHRMRPRVPSMKTSLEVVSTQQKLQTTKKPSLKQVI